MGPMARVRTAPGTAARPARRRRTVRTRVLATMLAMMAGGLVLTGVLAHLVQLRSLEERVEAELWQEYRELELVATSTEEGEPAHSDLDELLRTVTVNAAPSDHESVLAIVDGEPRYKPLAQDFEMDTAATVEHVLAVHEPGRTVLTSTSVGGREVRMLVASVEVRGDDSEGVFVVASDVGSPRRAIWTSAATFAGLSAATIVLAGLVGALVTGRLLRPLEDLRRATEEVTVADLEHRVPVPSARDDVAALATNFNRMLERIQEGFGEQRRFMSDVGHELRTPLTIVQGTLETTDPEDPEDVREGHRIAADELDRMGRVVGDLSELAASARPDYVRPALMDLGAFTRSVFARIQRIDADRDWRLEALAEGEVLADEQRLAQALVQLAANAVRYSAPGSRITLGSLLVDGPEGLELHLRLRDEGVGIAPEDQERIFERFTRVDPSRDGSGLGLPIVLAIARGHGGTVRLRSRPGDGSTFTLVLPRPDPDHPWSTA